jgi:hypothetical protein
LPRNAHTMLYNLALHKLNSLEADTLYTNPMRLLL